MIKKMTLLSLLLIAMTAFASSPGQSSYYEDRFLICLEPGISLDQVNSQDGLPVTGITSLDYLLELRGITEMKPYLPGVNQDSRDGDVILSNIYRLKMKSSGASLEQLLADFNADKSILRAEREAIDRILFTPNDNNFNQQWHLTKIQADDAWDLWDIAGGTDPGSFNIVMASVDTGVQYTHPDLQASSWVNQAEIPADIFDDIDSNSDGYVEAQEILAYISDYNSDGSTNLRDAVHSTSPLMDGIDADDYDNDPNSIVDDLFGWDPSGSTVGNDPDNDPLSYPGVSDHGTHVAGLLGATTNNGMGVSSAIFKGSIMSVKCSSDEVGGDFVENGWEGIVYASQAGADIINCSWGGTGYVSFNQNIINSVTNNGALVVAAAGNGNDDGSPSNVAHYPSGYDNVFSVTALGSSDNFSWANYGNGDNDPNFYGVDISAPGENMMSTTYTNWGYYTAYDGTSMASPMVASCIGLLKSLNPDESNEWLMQRIKDSSDPIDENNPNFAGHLGAGRINIYNALASSFFPRLTYASHSLQLLNDNGDGTLAPGEGARMRVNLVNDLDWVSASNVTAVLSSSSEFITITDNAGSYGNINSGNVGINIVDRYEFTVSPEAPVGAYSFSLEVSGNSETDYPYVTTIEFEVEVSLWQLNFPWESKLIRGGNAVVDLDGDGDKEVIFGSYDSSLHAIDTEGAELDGFPVLLGYLLEATPAVGDIDNDGDLEVVIGGFDRHLYVVQHDGSSASIYFAPGFILAPSTLYDLDGDGDLEIITPTIGQTLAVMHHDGTALDNFPLVLGQSMSSGVAVGDINGDGQVNIVVGTWGNQVHGLNLDGSELPGFPIEMTQPVKSAPILANLDGSADGSLEILFGCDDDSFYAFDASGTQLWVKSTSGQNIQSDPAVSDLDGDGDLEIVFGGLDRNIYALDHTGVPLEGWPILTGGAVYSSPAIGDIDSDGQAEIFVGSNDRKLYGFRVDGSPVGGFPVHNPFIVQGAPSIEDLDGDTDIEIIVGTEGNLMVLDLPYVGETADFWPTHRGNLHRTGNITSVPDGVRNQELPLQFALKPNFPNPFNPSTQINFEIPEAGYVSLQILDLRGREVDNLVSEYMQPGTYALTWTGASQGKPAEVGIYFCRLTSSTGTQVRKMTLLK